MISPADPSQGHVHPYALVPVPVLFVKLAIASWLSASRINGFSKIYSIINLISDFRYRLAWHGQRLWRQGRKSPPSAAFSLCPEYDPADVHNKAFHISFRIIGVLEAIVYHSKTGQVLHPYRLWMQGADYRVWRARYSVQTKYRVRVSQLLRAHPDVTVRD